MSKSGIKEVIEVTLNVSSNLARSSNSYTTFPHELLLTDAQASRIRKAFTNDLSANIKSSEPHFSKMIQSGGVICNIHFLEIFY